MEGFCSSPCRSSAGCAGGQCAYTACLDGQDPTQCGLWCLDSCIDRTCAAGTCTELGRGFVCTFRAANGTPCVSNTDCISGLCAGGVCTRADGALDGSPCVGVMDCGSRICLNGACHGTKTAGDSCASEYECASGNCASGTCTG
ncbi:MAG TPA: hypothetical protein VHE30_04490 [Polyangiaceae bacterium]|nr:hypothetical protein [Polyangiaceae bacterium]